MGTRELFDLHYPGGWEAYLADLRRQGEQRYRENPYHRTDNLPQPKGTA